MPRKAIFDFEWITISYRAIGAVAFVLLAGGGIVGYQFFFSKPEKGIETELKTIEFRLEELSGKVRGNVNMRKQHEDIAQTVSQARDALVRKDVSTAQTLAKQGGEKLTALEAELERLQSSYSARIVSAEGPVKVKRAGDFRWLDAKPGTDLKEGDKVRTGDRGGAEVVYSNGDRQVLIPGSMCEIYESKVDPITSAERVSLRISGAATTLTTQKKRHEGSYTRLLTEQAIIEVPGAKEAELLVSPRERETEVRVIRGEGIILKDTQGREHGLAPQTAAVASDKGQVAQRELPPAPLLLAPQPGYPFVFSDTEKGVVTLQWKTEPRVRRYHLIVSNSQHFASALVDQKVAPNPKGVSLNGLVKGTYFWKVAAIDATDFESPFSESRSFRVITDQPAQTSEAPSLKVAETVQIGPFLLIKGKTDSGAYLTVDDKRFDIRDDGSFDAMVKLERLGENRIVIVARSAAGAKTEKIVTFYFEQ